MKILLTGRPGSGKTTVIKKFVKMFGENVVGFWTEEIRDPHSKKRRGFTISTTDGKSSIFACIDILSPYKVGKYGVDLRIFEMTVLPLLKKSFEDERKIVVVDEIGKMELLSEEFVHTVELIIFEGRSPFLGTIPSFDVHPLVSRIRRSKDLKLISVEEKRKEEVLEEIVGLFRSSHVLQ